jgi:hypothetical protein
MAAIMSGARKPSCRIHVATGDPFLLRDLGDRVGMAVQESLAPGISAGDGPDKPLYEVLAPVFDAA